MANLIIHLETGRYIITPFGFHKYATEYWECAAGVKTGSNYSPVPYFLYCRAIELALKAFLIRKGKTLDWVKTKLGHDLLKSLNSALKENLQEIVLTSSLENLTLKAANKYYASKGFEYFFIMNHTTGLSGLPEISVLKDYGAKLLNGIKPLTDNTDP